MLKKLAKYGNSTTLVIDKSILELLNMNESSIVKLQTDGKSLIITPIESIKQGEKISYDTYEALVAAKQSFEKKLVHKELDKQTMKTAKTEYQGAFEKHTEAFIRFNTEIFPSKKFQDALASLTEKIDPASQGEAFIKEFNNLRIQFCPEMAELQKEIETINKKYNSIS
jgi:antitoxin component of MazEF toxin-antitoxin module